MTDTVTLTVVVHTPFRIATGSARAGSDTTVDLTEPIPGRSLKGLMRDAARDLLGGHMPDHPLVVEVFGSEQPPGGDADSPWHWENVVFDASDPLVVEARNRLRIDPDTGTAISGDLLVADEIAPATGTVEIWRSGAVTADQIPVHRALLVIAARLIDGLGSDRRAGNGWVSLAPVDSVDPSESTPAAGEQAWAHLVDLVLVGGARR